MDDLFIILVCATLVTCFVMPWINHWRIGVLNDELSTIRRDINFLRHGLPEGDADATTDISQRIQVAPGIYRDVTPPQLDPAQQAAEQQHFAPTIFEQDFTDTIPAHKSNFELNLGTKLPVWIGSVSLICAAFFLAKYSIDAGWLGPVTRLILGGLFGGALTFAGQWIAKKETIANHERIAQGLVGAGLVSLYVCLYAAVNLYALLPPFIGFCGMAGVTALAVILSLRHGQPIAAFGLIGGLLTPALVGSDHADTLALFAYLFLLFSGITAVLARKGWWILAAAALCGVFAWTAFWCAMDFAPADTFIVILFAMGICGVVLAATASAVRTVQEDTMQDASPHAINYMAIGGAAATILFLGVKISLSLFDWSMLELLSLACIGLAFFRPDIYRVALWGKLAADLILYAIWSHHAPLSETGIVAALLAAVYSGIPYTVMRRMNDPRFWAGVQAAASVGLYVVAYNRIEFETGHFWGALGLALAGLSAWQAREMRLKYHADALIQDHLTAIYALAATSFISLGFAIELPWQWLPLAFAMQMAATMWIGRATGIAFMQKIAALLCLIFIGLNYEQLWLFVNLAISSFTEQPVGFLDPGITQHSFIRLVLPALMTVFALTLHRREDHDNDRLSHLLFGTALALALDAAYILIRALFHQTAEMPAGFMERGAITVGLSACALALIYYARIYGQDFLTIWGKGLFHLAMLRIVWFDLLIHNPYFDSSQLVGHMPLLNGVTMTYGAGTLLSAWAAHTNAWNGIDAFARKGYKAIGFAILFALVSLTVRQLFHGAFLAGYSMDHGEFYAYSMIWLVTALGLLAFGIYTGSRTARMASLAFMLLTVGKVFLLDAGQLEGLYRIGSFLGLGLSLIGLSFFYTKFILKGQEQEEHEKRSGPWWF